MKQQHSQEDVRPSNQSLESHTPTNSPSFNRQLKDSQMVSENNEEEVVDPIVDGDVPSVSHEPDNEEQTTRTISQQRKKRWYLAGAVIIFLLVVDAIAITVALVVRNNRTTTVVAERNATTMAPTLDIEDYLLSLLPNFTLIAMNQSSDSPQAKAFQWLLEDVAAVNNTLTITVTTMDEYRIHQRFALATTYFALQGNRWLLNENWLRHDIHECLWWTRDTFLPNSDASTHILSSSYQPLNVSGSCESGDNYNATGSRRMDFSLTAEGDDNNNQLNNGVYYQHLWLWENNLRGTLPPELFWGLSHLQTINLDAPQDAVVLDAERNKIYVDDNVLVGTIPSHIGLCTDLQWLSLQSNQLSGTMPWNYLANHPSLSLLQLDWNNLQAGLFSSEIGLMTSLESLFLIWNDVTGTLPSELGLLTGLMDLDVSGNDLTGTLPSELGLMTVKIRTLAFHGNYLTGFLPSGLGLLTGNLRRLELTNNSFTGTIPTEWEALAHTPVSILLQGNYLTGTVPPSLCSGRRLVFDCSPHLCGCGWRCPCNETRVNTTISYGVGF